MDSGAHAKLGAELPRASIQPAEVVQVPGRAEVEVQCRTAGPMEKGTQAAHEHVGDPVPVEDLNDPGFVEPQSVGRTQYCWRRPGLAAHPRPPPISSSLATCQTPSGPTASTQRSSSRVGRPCSFTKVLNSSADQVRCTGGSCAGIRGPPSG